MIIIKKETVEFSEKETNAINLVCEICSSLMRESTEPDLIKLAEEIYDKLSELLAWEE